MRVFTVTVEITAPTTTGEREVEDAINGALDEPPCEWWDWTVGPAQITHVAVVPTPKPRKRAYQRKG